MMSFGGRTDTIPQTFNAPVGGSPVGGSPVGGSPVGGSSASEVMVDVVAPVAVAESKMSGLDFTSNLLTGDVIAPKLENATAKYVFPGALQLTKSPQLPQVSFC